VRIDPAKRCLEGLVGFLGLLVTFASSPSDPVLVQQNEIIFQQLQDEQGLDSKQVGQIREIFAGSGFIGQGNPALTQHPETTEVCEEKRRKELISDSNPLFEKICHGKHMAPLYDPKTQKPEDAKACIDQYEFPDIPCAYPVVWVRAREAAEICSAEGKRLCDAHEWEGACAGSLQPPDYPFALAKGVSPEEGLRRMRSEHNHVFAASKSWSYGPTYRTGVCATGGHKTPGCPGGEWGKCGSNTYPAGDFQQCQSELGVYDLNGNAAEHMNLPLDESQMSSRGSAELGYTEMKGSWFVFDTVRAHEDWCRWRAPFWHGTRVMAKDSHANYHLGFRCCKDP